MQNSSAAFSYRIQKLDSERWHDILDNFQDANIFQTTAFGVASSGSSDLEYFLLQRDAEVLAAAQVRLIRIPLFGTPIAYVLWGPLFLRQKSEPDLSVFRQAIRSLRDEYVVKRRMSLRINPQFTLNEGQEYLSLLLDEGYTHRKSGNDPRTILVKLDRPIDELRKGLDQKWRNCLNRAEKNGLELREGNGDAMFDVFLRIYRQMLTRKRLAEPGDIRAFMNMQHMLPAKHMMKVIVALENGEPSAGAICSAIGNKGVYLFGATADIGLKNKAAYLVQWKVMEWLKELNCVEYDLHGVNAQSNPGVYSFKTGLCGKNGKEVEFLGNFDAYNGKRGKLLVALADLIKNQRKKLKNIYGRYRGFTG